METVTTSLSSLAATVFSLNSVYVMTGAVLVVFAVMTFADRANPHRVGSGFFWLILGTVFALSGYKNFPHWLTGLLILVMVAIDGAGRISHGNYDEATREEQAGQARRLGDKIFLPVLVIPIITFAFASAAALGNTLWRMGFDINRVALIGLGFGGIAAMAVGLRLTGGTARTMMQEGRRLNDAMGAVSILPQLLASLGIIFTAAKVGDIIAGGIYKIIPGDNLFLLVLANCLGMALFTIVMGNSFAAFPVIAAGVLVPLIIKPFGVNPAMAAIITLTAGSSGTLMTPMAANFNIVPTALLNMRDQYGVIKFQLPFALTIWSLHVVVMWLMIKLF
ncbi:MAG TPA: DUF979 domain-containing protein [Blastocatellia bacterium]|jgi:uncharacterized membrane protein|nr:DUF979 domain-containing protein [Blastocatellia bacterium]